MIEDAARIAETHIQAWRVGYKGVLPDEYLGSLSIKLITEQWQDILNSDGPGTNLVIEYDRRVSGFCVFGPARDKDLTELNAGELVALNILPVTWRLGLGTKLIKHVIKIAYVNKWNSIYLWVIKENAIARYLYESFGFEVEGQEKIDTALTGCELHEIRYVVKLN